MWEAHIKAEGDMALTCYPQCSFSSKIIDIPGGKFQNRSGGVISDFQSTV